MELTWRGWCRRWRCAPGCSGSLQWRSWCGRQFQSFHTCLIDSELKSHNEKFYLNLSLCLRTHLSWAAGSTGVRGTDRGALRSSWGQNLASVVFIRVYWQLAWSESGSPVCWTHASGWGTLVGWSQLWKDTWNKQGLFIFFHLTISLSLWAEKLESCSNSTISLG